MRMKKIRFLLVTLVALLAGVSSVAAKTVYIQPNDWSQASAVISLNVWVDGSGGNTWATLTEVETGILKATFDDSFDKMAILRANSGYGNKWKSEDGTNVWNQSADIDIVDGKLYSINSGSWDGAAVGSGITVSDYTEPVAAGYKVDFNTAITTSNHDFAVASNWGHIVGTNNFDNYGPYYMSYSYSSDGGVDGSGALRVGAQNGYYGGSTQSGADFTDGNYDYLITPKVKGTVTLKVKRYPVSGYASYVKIFQVNDEGTTVGAEITTNITPAITDSEWSILTLSLSAEQRLAIRAQSVLLDDFTAESATIIKVPGMTITSVKRADSESTTYFDMNADGSYTVKYLVKVKNTGETALVSGTTENFSLSVSIDNVLYGSFSVPVDLAIGETSEEFLATIVLPSTAPTGWKYRYLAENLGGTKDNSSLAWSNTLAYNPVPFFIKKGDEPISKGSSLTSVATLNFGMISSATTENYEIFAHNAGDLTIKSITAPAGFSVAPAETLPFTIPAHSVMFVDVTADGLATASGDMVITYVDKNGADQTLNVTLSQTYMDPSKWMVTFDGGNWPEGSVHESNLSISSNTYYGYDNAVKSSSSTYNKFYTPLLHAAAGGEVMSFDAMLDASYGTLNVYVTNDRSNLGSTVLHLDKNQLNINSMTNVSVTVPEGDWYVVFEAYKSMFDNLYGLELVPVAHDIMINSYKIGYYAVDKTIQTGTDQDFNLEITPAISEAADAYTVKLYANNVVVATADGVALTSGTSKTLKLNWSPIVTTTTVFETHMAIEFADNTSIVSPSLNLTVTCEPIFVFFDAGTTVGSSQPSNRSKAITFGKTNELNQVQNFEIYNYGKADLTVKSITVPEGFAVSVANAAVAPATRQPVDITFSATTPGTYEGNLAIIYVDKDGADQTFTLAVSGTMLDPTKWYANFDNTTDAVKWPAGSVYQSNVSSTYRGTYSDNNYFIYNSSYTTNNMFITPKLSATAGELFQFDAAPQSSSYAGYIKIYTSTDRETWGEPVETIDMPKAASYSETNVFTAKSVAMPAGEYYVGIQMYYAKVDEIAGLTPVAVAHDLKIASSNIPTDAMQNYASTATVNVLNFGLANDKVSVTAYVNGVAVATSAETEVAMNHKLTDAGTQISVSYMSNEAGTFPVYLEVKAGDVTVSTDPVDVTFAAEEAKSEADMATNGTTGEVPVYLNYKNSESVTMYNAEALANAGLSAGSIIKKITYKGYKTSDEQTTSFQVYYKWTDDQTLSQPATAYPFDAVASGMTNLIDEDHTWTKVGSSTELGEMIVLDFSSAPLTYEAGKSLVIYMHSYVDAYKTAYFEKSTLSSDFCYKRQADAASISGAFSKAIPAALHFTLESSAATLAGKVLDSEGNGIYGATITLKADNGVQYSGNSIHEGNYSFDVIQSGLDFTVTVEAPGYLKRQFPLNMGGTSVTQDVTMYKQFGIVGSLPGLDWDNDLVMTQDAENPNIFVAEMNDVLANAGEYEFKLRADGAWSLAAGYYKPNFDNGTDATNGYTVNNSNYQWEIKTTGTYNYKFTFDWANHTLTFERPYTLAEDANGVDALNWVDVTIEREFKAGWNAVVLPFNLTKKEVINAFGANSEVAECQGDNGTDNVTVYFMKRDVTDVDDIMIEAGTPYLIWLENPVSGLKFTKDIVTNTSYTPGQNFDFVGVYTTTPTQDGDYFVKNGEFQKCNTTNTVKPFRSYLKYKGTSPVRSLNFVVDDETITTEIDGLEIDTPVKVEGVYNLNGQKVENLKKGGLYIINGKKVIWK